MNERNFYEELTEALKDFFGKQEFELVTVPKNGILKNGIRINQGKVSPVVYYDVDEPVCEIVRRAKMAAETAHQIDFDPDSLDRDYFEKNLYVTVQKKTADGIDIVKKDFLNLEAVLILNVGKAHSGGSIKVMGAFLAAYGLTLEEAWGYAMRNVASDLTTMPIAGLIGAGVPDPLGLTAVTTKNLLYGAAALLFPEIFRKYCNARKIEACRIIPSSIHEVLVIPVASMPLEDLRNMVAEINSAEVIPEEQLEPVIYEYTKEDNEIRIAR